MFPGRGCHFVLWSMYENLMSYIFGECFEPTDLRNQERNFIFFNVRDRVVMGILLWRHF